MFNSACSKETPCMHLDLPPMPDPITTKSVTCDLFVAETGTDFDDGEGSDATSVAALAEILRLKLGNLCKGLHDREMQLGLEVTRLQDAFATMDVFVESVLLRAPII